MFAIGGVLVSAFGPPSTDRLSGRWKWRAIVSAAWLLVAPVHGQEIPRRSVDLKCEVDPALQVCPNLTEFRSMVAQQLGYDPHRDGSSVGVRVRVRSTETGIGGTIEWTTTSESEMGERRFVGRSEDCQEMMATVAFVVAVQIQLMAVEQPAERASQFDDAETTTRRGSTSSQVPADRNRNAKASTALVAPTVETFEVQKSAIPIATSWSVTAGLGSSLGLGLAPTPVAQGRLFVAIQFRHVVLEAGAEASLPSTTRQVYGGGFRHDLMMGTLAACAAHRSTSVCGLGKLGRIQVHGLGIDEPASPQGFVAQIGPRLAYSLSLGDHLVLLAHVDALYLLTPWTVELNRVSVWTMPRFSAVAGIGLAAHFR